MIKNKKGFTLIEVVVALGLLVMLGSFTLATLSSVPQFKIKRYAQDIKTSFELTRNYAQTKGGNAVFELDLIDDGISIKQYLGKQAEPGVAEEGTKLNIEETVIKDKTVFVYYKMTGDDKEYALGYNDHSLIDNNNPRLTMEFSQTKASVIGPHLLDYIRIANGSKSYKLYIQQTTGMIFLDSEVNENEIIAGNKIAATEYITVDRPTFIQNGLLVEDGVALKFKEGFSQQPELNYDPKHVRISGSYRAEEKGTYRICFSLKNPYEARWKDGTASDIWLTWYITE